jgi:hypothetical protein
MTPEDYAAGFVWDLEIADLMAPRTLQDDAGEIGGSSFACREQMRRIVTKADRTDSPSKMPALIGNYIDAGVKAARKAANPNLEVDLALPVTLGSWTLTVHPDEIDPEEPSCTDLKTKDGLAAIRRGFVEPRHRIQRHLCYYAAHVNGLVPSDGIVRNVFLDRSGKDQTVHVEQEPFDMAVVDEAANFLADVKYAIDHDETAAQDMPRFRCAFMCPWFTACRGNEINLEPITDDELGRLVAAYYEAKQTEKQAKELADELRAAGLEGVTGRTATHVITSTVINPVNKASYTKISVEAL